MKTATHYPTWKDILLPGYEKEPGVVKMVCITHKHCLDGMFSAIQVQLIRNILVSTSSGKREFQIAYIEKQYGVSYTDDDMTTIANSDIVFMVDMSMDMEQLAIIEPLLLGAKFIWIDHHVTSIPAAEHIISTFKHENMLIDISSKYCAAMIIHTNFDKLVRHIGEWVGLNISAKLNLEPLLKYVNDRDMWANQYPETNANTTYLYVLLFDGTDEYAKKVDKMANLIYLEGVDAIVRELEGVGKCLLSTTKINVCRIMERATAPVYVEAFGCSISMVNSPIYQSELGAFMYNRWPEAAAMIYNIDTNSGRVNISFRSGKMGPNVEEIARRFGGGGHINAAGCSMSISEFFEDIL